jgi:hypothetical protein
MDKWAVRTISRFRGVHGGRSPPCALLFGAGVPRRHSEAQDVGEGAGVPVGDGAAERRHRRRQHGLGRDDAAQRGQPAVVLTALDALEDEAVDVLTREPDPDPDARPRLVVQVCGNGVVEGPVEVGGEDLDDDARDRQRRGRPDGRLGTATAGGGPEQLQLLGGRVRRRLRGQPTTDRRASTRSVRSQVNSGSSRPKCP